MDVEAAINKGHALILARLDEMRINYLEDCRENPEGWEGTTEEDADLFFLEGY